MSNIEKIRKVAQARAEQLRDSEFSPKYEKHLESIADEFVKEIKNGKKNS